MSEFYFECREGFNAGSAIAQLSAAGAEMAFVDGFLLPEPTEENHGRTMEEVRRIIGSLPAKYEAKKTALRIYKVIAEAEARVHGGRPESVHFHEVARNQAICNMLKVGEAVRQLAIDSVICSEIPEGCGTVRCSHGELPVPVPAVREMMQTEAAARLKFVRDGQGGERITPSGLAILLALGAEYKECQK